MSTKIKHRMTQKSSDPKGRAFTLVELLVVLGILAMIICVVFPAMARTGSQSRATGCLNSHRQLWTVWRMYADDNSDKVIYNMGVPGTQNEVAQGSYRNWVNNNLDWTTSNGLNTNRLVLDRGLLGPYLRSNYWALKCPADNYLSPQQVTAHWTERTRSFSMNAFFGRYNTDPNDVTASGKNEFFPQYRQWLKTGEVPKPAATWIFIDEQADSINDGVLINNINATSWSDLPGSYHDGAANLCFVDGHGETHKWLSNTSIFPVGFSYPSPPSFDFLGYKDFQWLQVRSCVPY